MDKRKCLLISLIILFAIFFIIGLTTYLCGCQDILQPNCLRFWKTEGRIIDHFTIQKTCSLCKSYIYMGKTLICSSYYYYDCFTSYAVFAFQILVKRSCNLEVGMYVSKSQSLQEAKNNYVLFNNYKVYVDKTSFECSHEKTIDSIGIVGFVFLILAALILFALILVWINYCSWKRRNSNVVTLTENGKIQKKNVNAVRSLELPHANEIKNKKEDENDNQAGNGKEININIKDDIENNQMKFSNEINTEPKSFDEKEILKINFNNKQNDHLNIDKKNEINDFHYDNFSNEFEKADMKDAPLSENSNKKKMIILDDNKNQNDFKITFHISNGFCFKLIIVLTLIFIIYSRS